MKSKLSRKIAALLLAAMMTVPAFSMTAAAAEPTKPEYIDYNAYGNSTFVKNNMPVIKAIANGMFEHQEFIGISSYKVSSSDAQALHDAVTALYPELFFVDPIWGISRSGGYLSIIKPKYLYDKNTCDRMLDEFYTEADYYLDQVSGELSVCKDDFSKAMVLHDELVLDANYQLYNTSQYTFMIDKYGLCENYTKVYAYLLSQVGIYSEIVDSSAMGHEWIKVKLGNDYYLVDVTWDDPTYDRPGLVSHKYFLLSDAADSKLDKPHHSYSNNHSSTNTKYDNAKFHNFNSKMCKLSADDTVVYAADSATSAIVKYNYITDTSTNVIDLSSEKWSDGGYSFWVGVFTGAGCFDGKLYYNTPNAIYCYDPSTGSKTKIAGNSYSNEYYGLQISGDNLYAVVASDPNTTGTKVFIQQLVKQDVAVNSVRLDKTSLDLNIGNTAKLTATVSPSDAANKNITWTTSNSSVATVKDGTVTAVAAGTATITASSNNGKTASCTVTVTDPNVEVTGISLNKTSATITKGSSLTLTATITPSNATDKTVTWSTDKSYVASVSNGKVNANSPGTATITAKTSNGKTATCTITVIDPTVEVTGISLNKTSAEITKGSTLSLTATVSPSDATDKTVTWTTSNSSVATVSNGTVTAIGAGTATITATTSKGITATCTITVKDPTTPRLNNTSVINSDIVQIGDKIRVAPSANGGSGQYRSAVYYKRSTASTWKTLGTEFGNTFTASNSTVALQPTSEGTFDIKVVIKDSDGAIAEQFFTVDVVEELELTNVSVMGRYTVKLGTAIPLIGKAVGGSAPYTYSFYFKRSTNTNWKLLGEKFTDKASARFKPTAKGTYDVRIDVKDSDGSIVKKYFTATVK